MGPYQAVTRIRSQRGHCWNRDSSLNNTAHKTSGTATARRQARRRQQVASQSQSTSNRTLHRVWKPINLVDSTCQRKMGYHEQTGAKVDRLVRAYYLLT